MPTESRPKYPTRHGHHAPSTWDLLELHLVLAAAADPWIEANFHKKRLVVRAAQWEFQTERPSGKNLTALVWATTRSADPTDASFWPQLASWLMRKVIRKIDPHHQEEVLNLITQYGPYDLTNAINTYEEDAHAPTAAGAQASGA